MTAKTSGVQTGDPVQTVLSRLNNPKQTGENQWQATCPAHADEDASLSIKRGDAGEAVLACQAGCRPADIVKASDLCLKDIFPTNPKVRVLGKQKISSKPKTTIIDATPEWKPEPTPSVAVPVVVASESERPEGRYLTDLWTAEEFVKQFGRDFRYSKSLGDLVWDGMRWRRDDTGGATRLLKNFVRSLYPRAEHITDDERRKAFIEHVRKCESAAKLKSILEVARSEASIAIRTEDLDADPWLLNVQNGTIDLRTKTLRPHRREDLITKLAPVRYDPAAPCPRWLEFLQQVFMADESVISFVRRALGHSLTGVIRENVLHFLYGVGANGKSTLVELILYIMGEYAMTAPPKLLIARQHDAHPTELADLRGMRFVASMESNEGQRLDEERVKRLTGGDSIKGRYMCKDFFSFVPSHKLFMATNHKPDISGTDHAIWRRPKLWPFGVIFTEPKDPTNPQPGEQDRALPDKLKAEAPGILAWLAAGCLQWQKTGLNPPKTVTAETDKYKTECDRINSFVEERCIVGENAKASASELYKAYREWAEGGKEYVLNLTRFGNAMKEKGYKKGEKDKDTRRIMYEGIGLLT